MLTVAVELTHKPRLPAQPPTSTSQFCSTGSAAAWPKATLVTATEKLRGELEPLTDYQLITACAALDPGPELDVAR